jgi:hypothetical protein
VALERKTSHPGHIHFQGPSHDHFRSFQEEFNKTRKTLQIEEDVEPFTGDKLHSWTRDGLPGIDDVAMNALLLDGPAAASILPGCAT